MVLGGPVAAKARALGQAGQGEFSLHDLGIVLAVEVVLENREQTEMHGGSPGRGVSVNSGVGGGVDRGVNWRLRLAFEIGD